ncbi:putative autophagy protein Atg27 [Flammula alnicola]|nr:putative autophagy protein Atg27 [Flammula alnicola]
MILRSQRYEILLIFSYLLFSEVLFAKADSAFDCSVSFNNTKFDLTTLAGEHVVNRTRDTPPSVMLDSLRFNLCADLTAQTTVPEQDQCPSGTRACLTKTNQKSDQSDRVVAVIPIAQTSKLEPNLSFSFTPKYLSLVFHGAEYPPTTPSTQQSLNLTLFCDPQGISDPKFVAYDSSRLDLEWSGPAGCPFKEEGGGNKDDDTKDEDQEKESVGSGIGWFFFVLLFAFVAYFGLGAYYNYSTYGATGYDLIPHRDFWKEVPYMLSDVISHLCSNVRPRKTSSRGGYISV